MPGVYRLGIVLISVVGTQITDNLTDNLGGLAGHHDNRLLSSAGGAMILLAVKRAGLLDLQFDVDPGRVLATLAGDRVRCN